MNRKKEDRAARLYSAIGGISPSFVEEAENYTAADETAKTTGKTSRVRVPAPAWLRPVAACLAVLILGGLVVFSIPVVNNIISHRGPAELPGTDIAEADTQEETKTETGETECAIGDKKIHVDMFPPVPDMSINELLGNYHTGAIIREEDVEKIKPGMTFAEMMNVLGLPTGSSKEPRLKLAINNGKMLLIERKYSNEDIEEMFKDQLEWYEDADGKMRSKPWPAEVMEAAEKIKEENPIEKLTIYDDPEEWEGLVINAGARLCHILNSYRNYAGLPFLTVDELREILLTGDIEAEILKTAKEFTDMEGHPELIEQYQAQMEENPS